MLDSNRWETANYIEGKEGKGRSEEIPIISTMPALFLGRSVYPLGFKSEWKAMCPGRLLKLL